MITRVLGRGVELEDLRDSLKPSKGTRKVVIIGEGGTGRTELVHQLAYTFTHGIVNAGIPKKSPILTPGQLPRLLSMTLEVGTLGLLDAALLELQALPEQGVDPILFFGRSHIVRSGLDKVDQTADMLVNRQHKHLLITPNVWALCQTPHFQYSDCCHCHIHSDHMGPMPRSQSLLTWFLPKGNPGQPYGG